MIKLKRIYDEYSRRDGFRIFVDRLWARGVKQENAHIDLWLKDIAPSTALRQWFNHEPKKWKKFEAKYRKELKNNPAIKTFLQHIKQHRSITLLYAAKDEQHNNAIMLKGLAERKSRRA